MYIEHSYNGMNVNAIVTDGFDQWRESHYYEGYTTRQAKNLFKDYLKANKWKVAR